MMNHLVFEISKGDLIKISP